MKHTLVPTLGLALMVSLSGCTDSSNTEDYIEFGKKCFEAGGSWIWSDWSGYACEFRQDTQ
jgi:hypothetical protein